MTIMRGGSEVAESSTGPSNRNENGFCRPPVRNSSTADLGDVEGEQPGGAVGRQPLGRAEAHAQRHVEPGGERDHREAGIERQLKSRTNCTTSTAMVWPMTAIQRSRISVSTRTLRPAVNGCCRSSGMDGM